MKEKWSILLLLLIMISGTAGIKAQSLIIRLNDGSENIEPLCTVQKLSFSVSDLLVAFKSGNIDMYDLSTLQKLYFDTNISVEESPLASANHLTIYPNPANETLIIQDIPDDACWVYIYRSDGNLVRAEAVKSGQVILNVSRLAPGLYLVNASGHSSKFVKQ